MKTGPSPRVRGNLELGWPGEPHERSIPACAGKPGPASSASALSRVHPRVCGETVDSPTWGGGHEDGSIPACAGKPRPNFSMISSIRVHPRVCRETETNPGLDWRSVGPSPRVRGNPGSCEFGIGV